MLFIPADWWHTTCIVGNEPSVSLGGNFVAATNREAFESSWADFRSAIALVKSGVVSFSDASGRTSATLSKPSGGQNDGPVQAFGGP